MTISIRTISELAIGELPESLDLSVGSTFRALLSDPDAQFIYLIELSPYNEGREIEADAPAPIGCVAIGEFDFVYRGSEENVYISDAGYDTEPGESPENTTYLPLTNNPFQFDVSIMQGSEFRGGIPSFGAIRILNGDKELDHLAGYYWAGRVVKVFAGQPDFARADFEKVFEGICMDPEFTEDEIIINIGDKSRVLETEFEQSLYEGTGSLEGGDDITGAVKPLTYGECLNVSPVLVDAANLIYQVHDGAIEAIDAVYDKGVALASGGNVADITATSVSAGQFKTQLSGGYIRLGSTPVGRITVDVRGDNTGGYVDNVGAIIQRVVKNKLGSRSFADAEIDGGAFNSLDATITGSVGVYVDGRTNASEIIDLLTAPLHAYWTFTRQGMLTAGVVEPPDIPEYILTEDQIESFEVLRTIPAAWRITLGYARGWTQQSQDDLAAAATSSFKTFVLEQYRKIISEDRNLRRKTASAVEREFYSVLTDSADAETELARLVDIYGVQRKVYRATVKNLLFRVYVGDTVSLEVDRFDLTTGKTLLITAISEDVETNTTILELWG